MAIALGAESSDRLAQAFVLGSLAGVGLAYAAGYVEWSTSRVTSDAHAVESLDPERARDLLTRVRKGKVFLLDVRSEEEYRAGHLPGARSLPLATLEKHRASELGLEATVPIAVYCRGRFCHQASTAANLLRRQGFEVENLYTSVVELASEGIVIEESEHSPLSANEG